jgi:hypothetical protein
LEVWLENPPLSSGSLQDFLELLLAEDDRDIEVGAELEKAAKSLPGQARVS